MDKDQSYAAGFDKGAIVSRKYWKYIPPVPEGANENRYEQGYFDAIDLRRNAKREAPPCNT